VAFVVIKEAIMNKKKIVTIIVSFVLVIILGLWISGIIPKQIAIVYATNYLKKNFPKIQLEYVNIEWASVFGGYSIRFKDENDKLHYFIVNNKYFPISLGQGLQEFRESYKTEYEVGILNIDDFYNHSIVIEYGALRNLREKDLEEQIEKNKCLVIREKIYNDNLYHEFMNKYYKKENTFIRVVQETAQGDISITDILYEAMNDKIHIVRADKWQRMTLKDNEVEYKVLKNIGEIDEYFKATEYR
jgi:hypothetical protein